MVEIKKISLDYSKSPHVGSRRSVLIVFITTIVLAMGLYFIPIVLKFWQRLATPAFI